MKYYAIKRKKDGKFVSGTDFRYSPPHCRFANEYMPPLLLAAYNLDLEIRRRGINLKNYKIVVVEVKGIDGD